MASTLINRNINSASGRTSMRLEPEAWEALRELCLREGMTMEDVIRRVERDCQPGGRTSAVRIYLLRYFHASSTDEGHRKAGHGTLSDCADEAGQRDDVLVPAPAARGARVQPHRRKDAPHQRKDGPHHRQAAAR